MIRSTLTPKRLNQASARRVKATALSAFLVGQDFAVGQAAGIVDGDVEILPAGAALVALAVSGALAPFFNGSGRGVCFA